MINSSLISIDNFVTQKQGNIVSDMDGEKVMLSIENGKYYNLGVLGGTIWDLINEPILINDLILKLMLDYEVEEQECEKEVLTFLGNLYDENLITILYEG